MKSGFIIWFTGLSCSSKTTIANKLNDKLRIKTCVLDGDAMRTGLCSDLGVSNNDRSENIKRIKEVCKILTSAGVTVLASFISPNERDRNDIKKQMKNNFIEVYCSSSLESCERRDIKGHYKNARAGNIKNFTGVTSEYQCPKNPDVNINIDEISIDESVSIIYDYIISNNYV